MLTECIQLDLVDRGQEELIGLDYIEIEKFRRKQYSRAEKLTYEQAEEVLYYTLTFEDLLKTLEAEIFMYANSSSDTSTTVIHYIGSDIDIESILHLQPTIIYSVKSNIDNKANVVVDTVNNKYPEIIIEAKSLLEADVESDKIFVSNINGYSEVSARFIKIISINETINNTSSMTLNKAVSSTWSRRNKIEVIINKKYNLEVIG